MCAGYVDRIYKIILCVRVAYTRMQLEFAEMKPNRQKLQDY